MPLYTVQVTLRLEANTQHKAYGYIDRLLARGDAKRVGIEHVDSKVVDIASDEPPEDNRPPDYCLNPRDDPDYGKY